jgi:hypothetical protein
MKYSCFGVKQPSRIDLWPPTVAWYGAEGALVGNLGEHEDDTGSHGMLLQLEQ